MRGLDAFLVSFLALSLSLGLAACEDSKKKEKKKSGATDDGGDGADANPTKTNTGTETGTGAEQTGGAKPPATGGSGTKPPQERPEIDDEGVIEVGADANDGDDDGDDSDDDGKVALTITGLRLDQNVSVLIRITGEDGKSKEVTWPTRGASVEVPDICGPSVTKIKIETVEGGDTFSPKNPMCFVGKATDAKSVNVGFEDDCDGLTFDKIDDAIALFTCPEGALTIDEVRLDDGINVGDWVD